MNEQPGLDALVIVPPLSPSDTNPPLGPYLLKKAAEREGLSLGVADLSVAYLNLFRRKSPPPGPGILGDQDKDRRVTHAARQHFIDRCGLAREEPLHLPAGAHPVMGMHYSFEAVSTAVDAACTPGSFWYDLLERTLRMDRDAPPRVVGLSIMGPPQVFLALVAAHLCRRWWPRTLIVAGGSHVSLLIHEIAREPRYASGVIDRFLPGHCEQEFTGLIREVRRLGAPPGGVGILPELTRGHGLVILERLLAEGIDPNDPATGGCPAISACLERMGPFYCSLHSGPTEGFRGAEEMSTVSTWSSTWAADSAAVRTSWRTSSCGWPRSSRRAGTSG